MSILVLPSALVMHVFGLLDDRDLSVISQVSREWLVGAIESARSRSVAVITTLEIALDQQLHCLSDSTRLFFRQRSIDLVRCSNLQAIERRGKKMSFVISARLGSVLNGHQLANVIQIIAGLKLCFVFKDMPSELEREMYFKTYD